MAKHRRVKVVPWLELVPTKKNVDNCLDGIEYWRNIAKTMIISVHPGHEDIFNDLAAYRRNRSVPTPQIIPGIKTYSLLDRFDSMKGWRKVAQSVGAILKHCPGATLVLLENETAVRPVWEGQEKVDSRRLKRAVRQLPRDVEYLWWPTYAGHSYTIQNRYFAVVDAVDQAKPRHVRFIDRRLASPAAPNDIWMRYAALLLDTWLTPISLIWCGGKGRPKKFWHYKKIPSVLQMVEDGEAILYPGSVRWVEAAKALSEILPVRGRRRG